MPMLCGGRWRADDFIQPLFVCRCGLLLTGLGLEDSTAPLPHKIRNPNVDLTPTLTTPILINAPRDFTHPSNPTHISKHVFINHACTHASDAQSSTPEAPTPTQPRPQLTQLACEIKRAREIMKSMELVFLHGVRKGEILIPPATHSPVSSCLPHLAQGEGGT